MLRSPPGLFFWHRHGCLSVTPAGPRVARSRNASLWTIGRLVPPRLLFGHSGRIKGRHVPECPRRGLDDRQREQRARSLS